MKFILSTTILTWFFFTINAQITFISPFTGDQGGATPLFGQYVPSGGSDMFVNFECFGSGTSGAGQGSSARVIIRGMNASADGKSVIASDNVCIVNGIYNGENGNNDVYFVNLNICNLPNGRYSIEVQCDVAGGDFDNSTGGNTAATTWNYWPPESPTVYYLGTSGSCGLADGLEDITEIGENGVAGTPQIEFFNVGDADVYRTMVVINGLFMDLGKFQPGNPTIPTSLHDLGNLYDPDCAAVGDFPTDGFCSDDVLIIGGAEVNVTKYTSCGNADVTGNRLFYRIYPASGPATAFSSFNIPFSDNCPNGYPGNGNSFPIGGSCQNENGILDQRWQTTGANVDLLALAPTEGTYNIDFYTETDVVNCSGAASTVREPQTGVYTTSFFRADNVSNPICTGLPVELVRFDAKADGEAVQLTWETATEQASSHFMIERSKDARNFEAIGMVEAAGESTRSISYDFTDRIPESGVNYYRLKMVDLDETFEYSDIKQVKMETKLRANVYPTTAHSWATVVFNERLSNDAFINVYDLAGRQVFEGIIVSDSDSFQLDMGSFSSGTFIIKIQSPEINYSTKIIKR